MKEFRIKINIKLQAEDMADAFGHLGALAANRANMIDADEDFTPDPEPEFIGEIDVHPTVDEEDPDDLSCRCGHPLSQHKYDDMGDSCRACSCASFQVVTP